MSTSTPEELERIQNAFSEFDKNGDGSISIDELGVAMKNLGEPLSAKQLKAMVESVDKDKSGTIDLGEFVSLVETSSHLRAASIFTVAEIRKIRAMFARFDVNGDGTMSSDELEAAMRKLGQKPTKAQIAEMMREIDDDQSGEISFEEFLTIMASSENLKKAATHSHRRRSGLVDFFVKYNNAELGLGKLAIEEGMIGDDDDAGDGDGEGGGACTGNIKTLAITAAFFALITALQTVGAIMANSKVLLADCVSMGVDACTYVANIFVECQKGTKCYKPSELAVGLVSIAILVYLTCDVMMEAIDGMLHPGAGDDEPVNPWIVLFFACLGIIFDCCSLHLFMKDGGEGGESANMFTALLHVGADFLRSTTTFVSSILMFAGVDTAKVDSWAAIILGVTILGGAAFGLWELCRDACQNFSSTSKATDFDDDSDSSDDSASGSQG